MKKAQIPKLMFVPTTWLTAFLEPIPPSMAHQRAKTMASLLPKELHHSREIRMIVHWTRSACVKG
jgi:hypothetical protein